MQGQALVAYAQKLTAKKFIQCQGNTLPGLLDLDLMLILAQVCSILILLALYQALRRASPSLMTIALTLDLFGIVLFLAVNSTFSMLYLSD